MSAYICDEETISAIAKAFGVYKANFKVNDEHYRSFNDIGQALLEQNYESVNYRYNEDTPTPQFRYVDVPIDEGVVFGCIENYIYQACETDDFFESDIFYSLCNLKDCITKRLLKKMNCEIPWGYDNYL